MNAQKTITQQLIDRGEIDIWQEETPARLIAQCAVALGDLSRTVHGIDGKVYWPHAARLAGELSRTALTDQAWSDAFCDREAASEQLVRLAISVYVLAEILKVNLPHEAIRLNG